MPIRILLQTTIPFTSDDWSVERFSLLAAFMQGLRSPAGEQVQVSARNRAPLGADDPVLSRLAESEFDQLWLLAVDVGDGLSEADTHGIASFRRRGGGLLASRDHQDLGCSLSGLPDIGAAQYFHTKNPDPDAAHRCRDDRETLSIDWPNFYSGRNGDSQRIQVIEPLHPLLVNPNAPSGHVEYFPAHPHEGAVGSPAGDPHARPIVLGKSLATGASFHISVAFDAHISSSGEHLGRAIADSSFHHFVDYNWDPQKGAPSFVTEPVGHTMREARAQADIRAFVRNAVFWLSEPATNR
jgi:hypothetical protein